MTSVQTKHTNFLFSFQVGMSAMDNQLLRYSAKDHFFRAVICRLCHYDFEDARTSLARYVASFPNLQDSRESKLLKVLLAVDYTKQMTFISPSIKNTMPISCSPMNCTVLLLLLHYYWVVVIAIIIYSYYHLHGPTCPLQALIAAVEEQNADSFTEAVKEYDSISRLDPWCTMILLRIKRSIPSVDLPAEGDGELL